MGSTNERRHYNLALSLIGCAIPKLILATMLIPPGCWPEMSVAAYRWIINELQCWWCWKCFRFLSLLNWNLISDNSPWQLRDVISPVVELTHDIITSSIQNHWDQDKMATILHTIFSNAFSLPKMFEFSWSDWQFASIGSEEGLAHNMWQAIIWTNDVITWLQWVNWSGTVYNHGVISSKKEK